MCLVLRAQHSEETSAGTLGEVVPENWTGCYGVFHRLTEEYEMRARRRFTADFKAKVVLEALRGDKSIQEISTRHKVHPNQVSTWKRPAMDDLGAVFSGGADKAGSDHETEVHDLHTKIDQLTVERDFLAKGLKR